MSPVPHDRALSPAEAARAIGVSTYTAHRMVLSGSLAAWEVVLRSGQRRWRVAPADVAAVRRKLDRGSHSH